MKPATLVLACALACAVFNGCSGEEEHEHPEPEMDLPRTDDPARVWLRDLRRAHARADLATSPEARREAADQLVALARAQAPTGVAASTVEPARQDLYGRAADLLALAGEHGRALPLLDEGLALRAGGPFFTQLVLQTAEVKAALGDVEGAKEARDWAVRLLR